MEGQKLLSLNRETLTVVGISLVPWLAALIAIVAMLNSFNSNINRGIDRLDASIKANSEALAATNAVIAANGEAISANGAALDSLLAQAQANGAALETLADEFETLGAKVKGLLEKVRELRAVLAAGE